ncbi:MAG: hypothetical protein AABY22_15395 [Nanoarchaeota archaeon]
MRKGESDIIRWIVIIVILLVVAFFVWKYKDFFFGEKIVNVEDCGDLNKEELRNDCCAVKYQNQPHVQCVGNWKYNGKECAFVCS